MSSIIRRACICQAELRGGHSSRERRAIDFANSALGTQHKIAQPATYPPFLADSTPPSRIRAGAETIFGIEANEGGREKTATSQKRKRESTSRFSSRMPIFRRKRRREKMKKKEEDAGGGAEVAKRHAGSVGLGALTTTWTLLWKDQTKPQFTSRD